MLAEQQRAAIDRMMEGQGRSEEADVGPFLTRSCHPPPARSPPPRVGRRGCTPTLRFRYLRWPRKTTLRRSWMSLRGPPWRPASPSNSGLLFWSCASLGLPNRQWILYPPRTWKIIRGYERPFCKLWTKPRGLLVTALRHQIWAWLSYPAHWEVHQGCLYQLASPRRTP